MILNRRTLLLSVLFLLFVLAWIGTLYCPAQQQGGQKETFIPKDKDKPEIIAGAPQGIRQKIGIWVFVAWMWISIFMIIYFLRLKMKEADRLYRLQFFSAKKHLDEKPPNHYPKCS